MLTKLTPPELIANMEAAAAKLTGQRVTVRLCKPNGANGSARKDTSGRLYIDLDPALLQGNDVRNFAYIFCHELAHIKLHHREMTSYDVNARPRLSEATAAKIDAYRKQTNPQVIRRESEADQLAGHWMRQVIDDYQGYRSATGDPIMAVLKILYHNIKDGTR